MTTNLVSALEIGTSRTVMAVGCASQSGGVELLALAEQETTGMRKGRIVEPQYVARAIQTVREEAESQLDRGGDIVDTTVICSFGEVFCDPVAAEVPVTGENGRVDSEDVARALDALDSATPSTASRVALGDTMRFYYTLDGKNAEVREPIDMAAEKLGVCGMALSVDENAWNRLEEALGAAGLGCNYEIFSGLAAASGALTPQQKEDGALCIDIGGGTTTWCAYLHRHPIAAGALPVGGDHVTNDLLSAFRPGSSLMAGRLKTECGRADPENIPPDARVELPHDAGAPLRTANWKAVSLVIQARLDETLRLVKADLETRGVLPWIGAGVVICGGSALMPGLPALVSRVFGAPCRLATLDTGFKVLDTDPVRHATIWGGLSNAVRYERRQAAARAESGVKRFFKNLFSREVQTS